MDDINHSMLILLGKKYIRGDGYSEELKPIGLVALDELVQSMWLRLDREHINRMERIYGE